ncbi:MAG: DEAD/DEAH box helicase [Emcibacter sp.]|nr:DEAD/DEAH box helicase [Emcibacter sp.]
MKLEANSKHLLAITKSKAKMYEFGVEEKHHIELYRDPSRLLITCIGILGELAHLQARKIEDEAYKASLKEQLVSVGQFFDALNNAQLEPDFEEYLFLVGAASYYLAEMPGSASVLTKNLSYNIIALTPNNLEGLLVWLLKSDIKVERCHFEDSAIRVQIDNFAIAYSNFFNQESSIEIVESAGNELRKAVYELNNNREFLFVDVIIAIASQKIANSAIQCLPKYTDLELQDWSLAIEKTDFISEFWPAQKLLGERQVLRGTSAIVQMPTSAGKTKSTELIIRSAFLAKRASVAVIVAPFRALCREISSSFQKSFAGENIALNELRDIPLLSAEENEFIKQLIGDRGFGIPETPTVIVSTPEKLVYLLRHEPVLAEKIGLLILDEGHQFDTGQRGVTFELLLASLKKQVPAECQKVLISAVMSNAGSIGDWLNGEQGIAVSGTNLLSTTRSVAFASWTTKLGQLEYFVEGDYSERDFFVPRIIEEYELATRPRETSSRFFPSKNSKGKINVSSIAAYLGVRLFGQGPVAVFCGDKRTIITICKELVDYFDRGLPFSPPIDNSDEAEMQKIAYLASLHWGDEYVVTKAIALGVLPHSANIPNGVRVSIESAMENEKACMVICTSTLAQGVNLPIKYLIVSSTFQGGEEISTRDFHNLIGRAGRSGYHTEGSIIFADPKIYDQRLNWREKWRWERAKRLLDFNNAEACMSSLLELVKPFEVVDVEFDLLKFVQSPTETIAEMIQQAEAVDLDTSDLIIELRKRENLVQAIESYLLAYLKDNPEAEHEAFLTVCKDTLAYSLADEEEKGELERVFALIFKRIQSLDKSKLVYFGKAILGLNQLAKIEDWLTNNVEGIHENIDSSEGLLRLCWPLIAELGSSALMQKVQTDNMLQDIAVGWIEGKSYKELLVTAKRLGMKIQAKSKQINVTMEYIVELTDNGFGYTAMLVIGALADVMEGNLIADNIVEAVRRLQSSMRYGLRSSLELWLFQKGYVDREVCKLLAAYLTEQGVDHEKFDSGILDSYREGLNPIVQQFPSYFHGL